MQTKSSIAVLSYCAWERCWTCQCLCLIVCCRDRSDSPPACMQVQPPKISMRDFEKVLLRARPTVSNKDLKVFEEFTQEFGEEG